MIDKATIDKIMDAANIVDVVSEFVALRKAGVNYKGLCPFHDEKTPSFMDMGVKLAHDFHLYKGVELELNAGVQNIFNAYQKDFDQGADRDSGYIYGPSMPRSWFVGLKMSF